MTTVSNVSIGDESAHRNGVLVDVGKNVTQDPPFVEYARYELWGPTADSTATWSNQCCTQDFTFSRTYHRRSQVQRLVCPGFLLYRRVWYR